jgi:hypothetical protein
MVVPVFTVEQKHIDISGQLAVLKAVVEEVHSRDGIARGIRLCKLTRLEPVRSDINGNSGFAGNQKRLVAELVGRTLRIDAKWKRGASAIAAGEDVYWKSTRCEQPCQGNDKRCLAGASGGQVPYTDHRVSQPAHLLPTALEAQLAKRKTSRIERHQRKEQRAFHAGPAVVLDVSV